jgi:outer membrane usher protein
MQPLQLRRNSQNARRGWRIPNIGLVVVIGLTMVGSLTLFPTVSKAEDQQAILELTVNLVEQGESIVILQGTDILIRVSDLEKAGLHNFAGQRTTISNEVYVSLASLAPGVTYAADEKELTLRLTVQPALLGATVVDLQTGQRPPEIIYSKDSSAFLNYAFNSQNFQRYSVFSEAGISIHGNLLYSSVSRNSDGKIVRGLTNLTLDNPNSLRSVVIGDTFSNTGNLGGGVFLGGVTVARNFGLDPYFIHQPTTGLSGAVVTPSTVDIYVNGTLLRREQLPPGQFELRNLPIPTGTGSTRYVIRDAFGREQVISSPYYVSEGTLPVGLSEYNYSVGFRRNNLDSESWNYDKPVFLGRHRVGLNNSLTAGLRLEATPDLVSGGTTISAQLPIGEIELAAAASHAEGFQGAAASLAYSYIGRSISFSSSVRSFSDHYANVSLRPTDDRALLEFNATAGVPVGSVISLSPQYSYSYFRDQGWTDRISLVGSARLTDRANLFLTASRSHQQKGETQNEVFLGLSYFFGNNTTGNLSLQEQNNHVTTNVEIQKSLPVGTGFGYRLQGQLTGEQNRTNSLLQYQGSYGLYELTYDRDNGKDSTTLNASGGVVAIGGNLFLTRPVQSSFALVQVPGVQGVRGYLSNQEIGRTNGSGNLIIPNLLPYYGNRLAISDKDIPLNYSIAATERVIAPPFRGGAIVRFPTQRIQNFTGNIAVEISGKIVVPSYGQLTVTVEGKKVISPLGGKGEFYLENLQPGRYPAEVVFKEGVCKFELNTPVADKPFVDLGTLRCVIP